MLIYSLHIFDKRQECLFSRHYSKAVEIDDVGKYISLINGLLFSLREFVKGISVKCEDVLHSFATDTFKLHYFESPTGYKFYLLSEPNCGDLQAEMGEIYKTLFVDYVIKNPLYKIGEKIQCHAFEKRLASRFQHLQQMSGARKSTRNIQGLGVLEGWFHAHNQISSRDHPSFLGLGIISWQSVEASVIFQ